MPRDREPDLQLLHGCYHRRCHGTALTRVLAGSGLSFRFIGANTVTIEARAAAAPAGDAAGLDTILVGGNSATNGTLHCVKCDAQYDQGSRKADQALGQLAN